MHTCSRCLQHLLLFALDWHSAFVFFFFGEWKDLTGEESLVDYFVERFLPVEVLVVNLAVTGWEDSYEVAFVHEFGYRLSNYISILELRSFLYWLTELAIIVIIVELSDQLVN
jgi:hypothetical protein